MRCSSLCWFISAVALKVRSPSRPAFSAALAFILARSASSSFDDEPLRRLTMRSKYSDLAEPPVRFRVALLGFLDLLLQLGHVLAALVGELAQALRVLALFLELGFEPGNLLAGRVACLRTRRRSRARRLPERSCSSRCLSARSSSSSRLDASQRVAQARELALVGLERRARLLELARLNRAQLARSRSSNSARCSARARVALGQLPAASSASDRRALRVLELGRRAATARARPARADACRECSSQVAKLLLPLRELAVALRAPSRCWLVELRAALSRCGLLALRELLPSSSKLALVGRQQLTLLVDCLLALVQRDSSAARRQPVSCRSCSSRLRSASRSRVSAAISLVWRAATVALLLVALAQIVAQLLDLCESSTMRCSRSTSVERSRSLAALARGRTLAGRWRLASHASLVATSRPRARVPRSRAATHEVGLRGGAHVVGFGSARSRPVIWLRSVSTSA